MLPSLRRGHFAGEDLSIRLSLNALVAQDLSPCACESLEFYCLLTLSLLNYDLSGPVDSRAEIVDLRSGQVLVARSFSPRSYHARSCQTCTCTQTCARTHTHTHTCTHAHAHTNTRAHTHTPVGHARMCAPWQKCYSTSGARWMRELQGTAMLPVC